MPDWKANRRKAVTALTKAGRYGYSFAYGKACKAYGLANALAYKYGYKGESTPGSKRTEREILADYVTSIIYERPLENDPINNPNKGERLNKIFESMDPEDVKDFKEELKELKKDYDEGYTEYKVKIGKRDVMANFNKAISAITKGLEGLDIEETRKVSVMDEISNILEGLLD
jgi:hypothetical protein|nr:MAG TPA_asm: hypothetical protein [Caudoviricetes sp.]